MKCAAFYSDPMFASLPSSLAWLPQLVASSTSCRVCGHWQHQPVCATCLRQFAPPQCRCRRCGLTLARPNLDSVCTQCEDYPPEMDQVVVAVDFAAPWSDLIGELKFQQAPAAARMLAQLLTQAVRQSVAQHGHPTPDLILPIPLSATRWQERGYNQAWLLAQAVSRALGWQSRLCHDTLVRRHDTGRLMSMHADDRVRRIRQAFAVHASKRHQVEGQHVVLVDDVMTTGATANEAARTLLEAGAASVNGWFAARTPAYRAQPRPLRLCPAQ